MESALSESPPALSTAPTNVRYGVLAFACSLSMITYLDRVAIASAAGSMIKDLGLSSEAGLKWAYTAFAFAYAAFEVPSGWMGDVYGPRRTLIRIVVWWSLFTAATGMVGLKVGGVVLGGIGTLIVIRFLFGMGEAGAYPNIARALYNWFPCHQRGFTQGLIWMSGRMMGGLTPLIWAVLISGLSSSSESGGTTIVHQILPPLLTWRSTFWVFGGMGLIWVALFTLYFRDRPTEHPAVNEAERDFIRAGVAQNSAHAGVPWGRILSSGNVWALCIMYACQSYGWYFNITYLPRFLEGQYGVPSGSLIGAIYKGGPLWLGAFGCLAGGILTDRIVRKTGDLRRGRRILCVGGHSLCAVCYLASIYAPSAFWFFLAVSLAAYFNDMTLGSSWAACQDVGKRYVAIVSGCMNTIGNLGGALAGYVTGYFLERSITAHAAMLNKTEATMTAAEKAAGLLPGYRLNFVIFAAVYVLAAISASRIDATKAVADD